jgi:hypothetical protein
VKSNVIFELKCEIQVQDIENTMILDLCPVRKELDKNKVANKNRNMLNLNTFL